MSVQNGERLATKQDLADMYQEILPYLGGSADAGFTPVGSVIAIMGVTAPANYLACNGQIVNVADYPELANYFEQQFGTKYKFGGSGTTFGVPDLRGEFLRGTGTNSHTNQGSGSAVGTHQDATRELRLFASDSNTLAYYGESANNNLTNTDNMTGSVASGHRLSSTAYTSTSATVAYTARPTNTSILWCIATKDIYLNPAMDYSTDEKVVGKWIDGKTLYQKTFTGTTSSDNTNTAITHGLPIDIGLVVNGYVTVNSTYIPIGFHNGTHYFAAFVDKTQIQLRAHQIYWNNSFVITIQYTKTTI